ncbi:zf-HC2 domain-containing protein [Streptomyces sp. NPDC001514]
MPLPARAHARAAELLTGYVQGLLDAPEDGFVSDHLAICPRCEHDVIRLTDALCVLHWAGAQVFPSDRTLQGRGA